MTISDLPDGIHTLTLHFNPTLLNRELKCGVKMWLKCRLPGWTGSAWVWLAWLGWLRCCLACRVGWPGLGLAGLQRSGAKCDPTPPFREKGRRQTGVEGRRKEGRRSRGDAKRGPWSTEGGQYLEKIKQKSREAFFGFTKRTFPRPPISTLGALQPSIVPEGTKVWRNGTCLTANSNIEIGGRGQRPSPTSPKDMPQLFQHLHSVRFSKFCPPPERAVPFLPQKSRRS